MIDSAIAAQGLPRSKRKSRQYVAQHTAALHKKKKQLFAAQRRERIKELLRGKSKKPAAVNLRSHPILNADQADQMTSEGDANKQQTTAMDTGDTTAGDAPERQTEADEPKSDAQTISDLMARVAELESGGTHLIGRGNLTGHNGALHTSRPVIDLTKVVNKPGAFDGTTAGRFHDWKNEVQMYLRVMNFPKHQEAGIVQSYLKGTALAWYIQKIEKLEASGLHVPTSWHEMLPLLNERFEHRNPELAARDKLMNLRQGSMTALQYLKEFEGCYAYIPRWDEADKIHRFLFGLRNHLRAKFCVDPATHTSWTSFDALVSYITSFMSDDMSHSVDVIEDIAKQGREAFGGSKKSAVPHSKPKHPSRWTVKKLQSLKKGEMSKVLHILNGGGVQKTQPKRQGSTKSYSNGNGEPVTRDHRVVRYCHMQSPQLCMGCYKPGHQVAQCTEPVAKGVPEGYSSR